MEELFVEQDPGYGVWQWALAHLADPPEWVRKGLGVSIAFAPLQEMKMPGGWDRVVKARLTEVSILRPSESPAHPGAQVVTFSTPSPPKATRADGLRFQQYAEEMGKKGVLVRRGIGQVLRVR